MDNFKNEDILISDLPKFENSKTNSIEPAYWKVLVINNIFRFVFLAAIIIIVLLNVNVAKPFLWFAIIAYPIFTIFYFILLKKSFNFRSYAIREHDIFYRHGILSRKTTIIPFIRIQHIAINEGFIERYYKLSQLQIFTAGSDANDLKISGLLKEDAEKIKELILGTIKIKTEEV